MRLKFYLAATTCSAMFLVPAAQAQQAPEATATQPPEAQAADPAEDSLDIIVSAQRREERSKDVPISLVAATGDQLQSQGVAQVTDLQLAVPGLTFSTQGAIAQPSIRGVATSLSAPGAESPVAIYVDGVYQPSLQGVIGDLPDVSRLEVSKGPQGTLFGRNATAGAIQIFTKGPTKEPTFELMLQDGLYTPPNGAPNANEFLVSAFAAGPVTQDISASLSLSYRDANGYFRDDVSGGRFGDVRSFIGRGKVEIRPTDNLKLLVTGFYTHRYDEVSEAAYVPDGLSILSGVPGAIVATQPYHVSFEKYLGDVPHATIENYGVNLRAELALGGGTLTSVTAWQKTNPEIRAHVEGGYLAGCTTTFACASFFFTSPSEMVSQEIVFASEKYGNFSFIAGAFAYREKAELHNFPNNFHYLDQRVKTESISGFAEGYLDVTPRLHLIGGLRYTSDYKEQFGSFGGAPEMPGATPHKRWNAFTPRASVRYDVTDQVNAYFTYSQGFKSGTYSGAPNEPAIDPEKLTSYEVGIKAVFHDVSFNLAAFRYDYTNLQIEIFNGVTTVSANADAKIQGFDFDAQLRLGDYFTLKTGANYLPTAHYTGYATALDFVPPVYPLGSTPPVGFVPGLQTVTLNGGGRRVTRTPEFTGNASINYEQEMSSGTWAASISVYHSSAYNWNVSGALKTGAYTTIASDISFKPASLPVKFTLFAKNLTNKAYTNGTLISAAAYNAFLAPPRQIGVRAELKF